MPLTGFNNTGEVMLGEMGRAVLEMLSWPLRKKIQKNTPRTFGSQLGKMSQEIGQRRDMN